MTALSADLHKAISTVWNTHGIDWDFKKNWNEANRSEFPSLHDQEASPGQPFPYCVFEVEQGSTESRMTSATKSGRFEHRLLAVTFMVYTRDLSGVGKSAKDIAQELVDDISKRFGGHPTDVPIELELDNGEVVQVQYQNDVGIRTGDEEYQWNIRYEFLLDVPVAV